jgi:hypothetical protein
MDVAHARARVELFLCSECVCCEAQDVERGQKDGNGHAYRGAAGWCATYTLRVN